MKSDYLAALAMIAMIFLSSMSILISSTTASPGVIIADNPTISYGTADSEEFGEE